MAIPPFWQAGSLSDKCPVSPRHFPCRRDPVEAGDVEGDDLNPNEAMEDGTEGKAGEEEPEEMKPMSSPPVPILPSREEVLKHRLTHRPLEAGALTASKERAGRIGTNSRPRSM